MKALGRRTAIIQSDVILDRWGKEFEQFCGAEDWQTRKKHHKFSAPECLRAFISLSALEEIILECDQFFHN